MARVPLFIQVIGVNGAGKTHLSTQLEERLDASRIGGDEIRRHIGATIRYFHGLDISHPNDLTRKLRPLVQNYRESMLRFLASQGETIIFDGSGAHLAIRETYRKIVRESGLPYRMVVVYCKPTESVILQRLAERTADANWQKAYFEIRKDEIEPPTDSEADLVIILDTAHEAADTVLAKLNQLTLS